MSKIPETTEVKPLASLSSEGEMVQCIRAFDWSSTPLGSFGSWSAALRTTVDFFLASRFPLVLWWGPDFHQLYNDAYRSLLGDNHPKSLGHPAPDCWKDVWQVVGPLVRATSLGAPPSWTEDLLLELDRSDFVEETHFTVAYSAVPDPRAPGGIGGVIGILHETSEKFVAERRARVLQEVVASASDAEDGKAACLMIGKALITHPKDIPFALLYLIKPDGKSAELATSWGLAPEHLADRAVVRLDDAPWPGAWPIGKVMQTQELQLVEDLRGKFRNPPAGPWSDPPRSAAVVPIKARDADRLVGLLIVGISPRLRFDDNYRAFLDALSGEIATVFARAQDYGDDRKRAEALSENSRAQTAFFGNVSHELRAPLALMLGPIEDELRDHPEGNFRLELAHRNSLRLLKLVNALLDFSRVEARRVPAVFEPTDLAAYTAELTDGFRPVIEKGGLKLEVDCPSLPELVYIDREMWEKVVLNLLSNAFKFTFEGTIEVKLCWQGERVMFSVSDTGTGIPSEEVPHIFERFRRVEGARSRTTEGTGIGLALVAELVHLQSGQVTVDSVLGKGSTFMVSLPTGCWHLPKDTTAVSRARESKAVNTNPLVEEASQWSPKDSAILGDEEIARKLKTTSTTPVPPASMKGAMHRIVVAEDNAEMRDYLVRLLSPYYEVIPVADGQEALEAVQLRAPHLILSDVSMPRLDGFDLLRTLRATSGAKTIPIILLSARAGEESCLQGLAEGADDYLVKPFNAREVLARIKSRLEMNRVRQEGEQRVTGILESITESFHVVDTDWRLTYLNAAARRSMVTQGLDPDAVTGKNFWNEVFPETRGTLVEQEYCRAMTERVPREFEYFYPSWQRWYAVRVFPIENGGISVYFHDIAERKRGEERVEFLSTLSRKLAGATTENDILGIAVEAVGTYLKVDRCYFVERLESESQIKVHRNWLRAESPSIEGRHTLHDFGGVEWWEQISKGNFAVEDVETHPLTRDKISSYLAVNTRSYVVQPFRREGEWTVALVVTESSPRKWTAEDLSLVDDVVARVWPLVEHTRVDQTLRESEQRFRALVTASSEIVYVMSADWSELRSLQGRNFFAEVKMPSRTWADDYLDPGDRPHVMAAVNQAILTKGVFELEHRVRRADGTLGWTFSRAIPRFDSSGEIVEWFGAASDITERKQAANLSAKAHAMLEKHTETLELRVAERTEKLRETITELESFSYSISHDLRAPLRAMQSFAALLASDFGAVVGEEGMNYIRRIMTGAERMDRLIQDVLVYSRTARGELPMERVELASFIAGILESYPQFDSAHAMIEVVSPLAAVQANPAALTQCISNLIGNAIKFVAPGMKPHVRIWTEQSADCKVRLFFRDNGVGIAKKSQEKIFGIFHQVNPSCGGTGIGLAVVRKAAERLGGSVSVLSEPGQGSTFQLELISAP